MKVAVAHEIRTGNSDCYHVLNDAATASLCGSINEESRFASDVAEVLPRESAERLGLAICGRCSYLVDQQPVDRPANVD
ncbi:hypothetical protein [Halorussus sp. AFM4]|uniref:hypothetical protein n=1 Tax=Halorussus sp. AFM4 TaxID=3421651 RepID=UPI003EB9359A